MRNILTLLSTRNNQMTPGELTLKCQELERRRSVRLEERKARDRARSLAQRNAQPSIASMMIAADLDAAMGGY